MAELRPHHFATAIVRLRPDNFNPVDGPHVSNNLAILEHGVPHFLRGFRNWLTHNGSTLKEIGRLVGRPIYILPY